MLKKYKNAPSESHVRHFRSRQQFPALPEENIFPNMFCLARKHSFYLHLHHCGFEATSLPTLKSIWSQWHKLSRQPLASTGQCQGGCGALSKLLMLYEGDISVLLDSMTGLPPQLTTPLKCVLSYFQTQFQIIFKDFTICS